MDRNLSGLCPEGIALHAHDVADIHLFEIFIGFLTQLIPRDIALDPAVAVLDVAEGGFAHDALAHQTSCKGETFRLFQHISFLVGLSRILVKMCQNVAAVLLLVVLHDAEGILPGFLQLLQFVAAHLLEAVDVLLLQRIYVFLILFPVFAHVLPLSCINKLPVKSILTGKSGYEKNAPDEPFGSAEGIPVTFIQVSDCDLPPYATSDL